MLTFLEKYINKDYSVDYRRAVLFSMINLNGDSVLDVGSGNTLMYEYIKDKFKKIYLSDVSDYLVKSIKDKTADNKQVEVLKIDAQKFQLDQPVDAIIACDVIEHLSDDDSALDHFYLNLKPNGRVFISVPAHPQLYGIRDKRLGHFRRYTKKSLKNKLIKAGFADIKIRYWNFLGVIPYFVSEKVLQTELKGPARFDNNNLSNKVINLFIRKILQIEAKIKFMPIGLTLIAEAKKPITQSGRQSQPISAMK